MKTLECHIPDELIELGKPLDAEQCPVALAIQASSPEVNDAHVGTLTASVYMEDIVYDTPLPQAVQQFVRRFDAGDRVMPLTFHLNIRSELDASAPTGVR
jgi:hypothetical protein